MATDIRTKIAEAMEEMSRTRHPDKISVQDLVNACGVSRQTFYYYFEDINAVMDLIFERGLRRALRKCSRAQTAAQAIVLYIEDFLDFHERINRGLNGPKRINHERFIIHSARNFVQELLRRYPASVRLSVRDTQFLVEFFAAGIANLIIWHGTEPMRDLPYLSEEIAALLRARLGPEQPPILTYNSCRSVTP